MHVDGTTMLKGPQGGQMATQMDAGRRGPLAVPRQRSACSALPTSQFFGGGVQARTETSVSGAWHPPLD